MSNKKGFKFAVSTVIKLLVFLIICMTAYCLSVLIKDEGKYFAPPVTAALITWVFLQLIEGNRRSFFAKGYMLENIIPGAVIGILTPVVVIFTEFVLGHLSLKGVTSGFDVREPLYEVFRDSLFGGIVFFGYFFHIIQKDCGNVPAVFFSSLIYAAFRMITLESGEETLFVFAVNTRANWFYISSLFLIGVAAGLCIIYLGDMRSAAAFLCLMRFAELMAVRGLLMEYRDNIVTCTGDNLAAGKGDFMYYYPPMPLIMAAVCVLLLTSALKKR